MPTSDPLGLVDASTATACLAGRVERAVSLILSGPEFRGDRGAEVAVLTLHAEPLGPPTVRVVEVAGTPLLRPEDGGAG